VAVSIPTAGVHAGSGTAASQGGGVYNESAFWPFDDATVRRNSSGLPAGASGAYFATTSTARGLSVVCGPGPGANIRKNTPLDCIFEQARAADRPPDRQLGPNGLISWK
jgi:hypothetical protein